MNPTDVERAVEIAVKGLAAVMKVEPKDVLLEEVERDQGGVGMCWRVTLSFPGRLTGPSVIAQIAGLSTSREYKVVLVDVATGELLSIKMRDRRDH